MYVNGIEKNIDSDDPNIEAVINCNLCHDANSDDKYSKVLLNRVKVRPVQ